LRRRKPTVAPLAHKAPRARARRQPAIARPGNVKTRTVAPPAVLRAELPREPLRIATTDTPQVGRAQVKVETRARR